MEEIHELLRRARRGMELGLEPTHRALAALGDPSRGMAIAHVAGSNGKGSVCAMVEAIARAGGIRTGLYTSPHLCRFAERIRIAGEPIDDDAFRRALRAVIALEVELTFFESLTVAALFAFREAKVDLAILEVGLGGRLDATNAITAPLVTAITSIALEHTAILGDTLDAIAREKAGILKSSVPVILGALEPEAERAILEVARAVNAPVTHAHPLDAAIAVGLPGPHQRSNAAIAADVARALAPRFPSIEAAIPAGLAAASWPGRFERIAARAPSGDVTILLDCAHNPHGALALARALDDENVGSDRTILLFGALADKAWPTMLTELAPHARACVYATPEGRTPAALGDLVRVAPGEAIGDPRAALTRALAIARPGETILVTGSIYLVGAIRGLILGIACDPVVAL